MKKNKLGFWGVLALICGQFLAGCDGSGANDDGLVQYTLAFNSHGGSAVESITADDGTEVYRPWDPAREGYTFRGWFSAETGGILYSWPYVLTANVTMHAQWRADGEVQSAQYTITFESCGGSAVESIMADEGAEVFQPGNPVREGYTFRGWFSMETGGTPYSWPYALTADVTMYAQWFTRHTITFESCGGSAVEPITVDEGTAVSKPGDPFRAGHTFRGWFSAETGGILYSWPLAVTTDVTMYAQWAAWCIIGFNTHGGSEIEPIIADEGTAVSKPGDPIKAGHTFLGWFSADTGGTLYSWPYTLTADMFMHAQWRADSEPEPARYTITFDSRGGAAVGPITADAGTALSKPDSARTGYTFQGWFSADTGGTSYSWPHTMNADITMYAHWNLDTYNINYVLNGGTNAPGNPASYTVESTGLDLGAPVRTGYTFRGWYDDPGFISGPINFIPLSSLGDITFYAKWTLDSYDQPITLTISEFTDLDLAKDAFADTTFTLARPNGSKTITVTGSGVTNITWYIGLAKIAEGNSVTLNLAVLNLSLGPHTLRVTAKYGGVLYSKEITFTITG